MHFYGACNRYSLLDGRIAPILLKKALPSGVEIGGAFFNRICQKQSFGAFARDSAARRASLKVSALLRRGHYSCRRLFRQAQQARSLREFFRNRPSYAELGENADSKAGFELEPTLYHACGLLRSSSKHQRYGVKKGKRLCWRLICAPLAKQEAASS
jgi:hypothetical protein